MGKRARLKRQKAAPPVEAERGPISEPEARRRARVYAMAGVTRGTIAWGSRARRAMKRKGVTR